MSSRTYHGELTLDAQAPDAADAPWLDDKTTSPYGARAAASGEHLDSGAGRAGQTTGEWRSADQRSGVRERADAELALFWQAQDESQRAEITNRRLEPRWLRVLALIVGALMCGTFTRVLLMPGAGISSQKRAHATLQPSAASTAGATLRIDSHPWSHVFVDDVPFGKTPLEAVQLQPGPHSVRLYNPERNLLKILTFSAQPGATIERVEQLEN